MKKAESPFIIMTVYMIYDGFIYMNENLLAIGIGLMGKKFRAIVWFNVF